MRRQVGFSLIALFLVASTSLWAVQGQSLVQGAADLIFDEDPGSCNSLGVRLHNILDTIEPQAPFDPWAPRAFDLALAIHPSFVDRYPSYWQERASNIVAGAAQLYASSNIELNVVNVSHIDRDAFWSLQDGGEILDALAKYYAMHHGGLQRDAVVLLVGQDVAGSTAGQVECVGGAKATKFSYAWVEAFRVGQAPQRIEMQIFGEDRDLELLGSPDLDVLVMAHELGHLLGAHHHYANCVEGDPDSPMENTLHRCSVMVNAIDLATGRFSSLNRLQVRGFAQHWDI